MLRIIIALVLAAHGAGHSIGVMGGLANGAWGGSSQSWLLTPILGRSAGVVEGLLWLLPTIGFIAAAGAFATGVEAWRALAVAAAVVSMIAIALFPQQLPIVSLVAAAAVNAAVLVALLILHWPAADIAA